MSEILKEDVEIKSIDELNNEINKLTFELFGNHNLNTNCDYNTLIYINNEKDLNIFLEQWEISAMDKLRRLYYLFHTNHLVKICCYNIDGSIEWRPMLISEFDACKFLKVPYTDKSVMSESMNVSEDTPLTVYNYKEKIYEKKNLSYWEIKK